jgi:hypothetical protein
MNLPNWSTNPHLRRVLQRMQTDYTSIFGGRDRELAALDAWLETNEQPYALLLAPTGRGKTALVWHWLTRQQHEWQVIFVPISIRYGNSSQADVFAALAHAFAHMHDELEEFHALQHSASELRPKLAAYLRRELPDDTRVLLVLDGLDEATGWELGTDLLPETPPENLKILLAARDMAQHSRADWYAKLGLQENLTQDFTLEGLDRLALRELLIALGTPLDELAGVFDVLGELLRVSAGDPVLVRLLVQLLREERIQIGQLAQLPHDDLNAVFGLWLQQLDGQQTLHAQILLHMLACAYGPLSAHDLLGLAGDHFTDAEQIAHVIAPLARFVIGDAESGYIFSHQKLRELYRDRWDKATFAEWNGRFVRYGKQAYQDPTPYLCRFLVAHLRDAGEWQFMRQLLAELNPQQAWAEARYALEGSYSGYLRDLDMLQDWAIVQNDLALNIHCSLIISSIISLSSNIDGELLVQLVNIGTTKGRWSAEAAFEHIEAQNSEQVGNLAALIRANIPVPWEQALEIIKRANSNQDFGYITLYPLVPIDFQETILEHLYLTLQNSSHINATQLLGFIENLSHEWQAKFIDCIFQAESIYSSWSRREWQTILSLTPATWHDQMLEFIQIRVQQELQQARHSIQNRKYPGFSLVLTNWFALPSEQQQILYWDKSLDIILNQNLSESIITSLPKHELQGILELLLQVKPSAENSHKLSPHIFFMFYKHCFPHETQLFDTGLELLFAMPQWTNREIIELLPNQYQEQIANYLIKLSIEQKGYNLCNQLIYCLDYVPNLRAQLIETILMLIPQSYKSIQNEQYLALLPYIPPAQQVEVIERALMGAHTIDSLLEQIELQAKLATLQPISQFAETSRKLFPVIQTLPHSGVFLFIKLLHSRPDLRNFIYDQIMSFGSFSTYSGDLIQFFDEQQQEIFSQAIFEDALLGNKAVSSNVFQYISSKQQQQVLEQIEKDLNSDVSLSLFRGLLRIPSFPHHRFMPLLEQIIHPERRMYLLGMVLPLLAPSTQLQLHPLIIKTLDEIQQRKLRLDYELSAEILHVITNQLLQNIEANLELLCHLQDKQSPSEQQRVSAFIWNYVNNNPAWQIDTIIEDHYLFHACLPHFNRSQFQTALEYALANKESYLFDALIPYFDQQQLALLDTLASQIAVPYLVSYYKTAHDHHHILDQASSYQRLIEELQRKQAQCKDQWDFIERLNQIAPYLQNKDLRSLYLNSINLLNAPYLEPDSSFALSDAMEHLQRTQLLNQQTTFQFVRYSSRQNRKSTLNILGYILPPYLETLEREQQQALASQVMQSVNQVVECWP